MILLQKCCIALDILVIYCKDLLFLFPLTSGGGRSGRISENDQVSLHSTQQISRGHLGWGVVGGGRLHGVIGLAARPNKAKL